MTGKEFAEQVDREMLALYHHGGYGQAGAGSQPLEPVVVQAMSRARLRLGVYNKRMITKALGRWIPCVEGDLTMLLIQQAQQEHQHRVSSKHACASWGKIRPLLSRHRRGGGGSGKGSCTRPMKQT